MKACAFALLFFGWQVGSRAENSQNEVQATGATETNVSVGNTPQSVGTKELDWLEDVASRITLHGYAQGGYTFSSRSNSKSNTFDIKRTLLWATADITPRWSFCFMHDFNSVVQEYYTDLRLMRGNALHVRFGQFKHGFSYENPLSPTSMETIDVYAEGVTYLAGCGSDPLYGKNYGRELGLSVYGETSNKLLRYEVNVLNGQGINQKDKNNKKDVIGRLEVRPCKGLNLVATGQLGYGNALKGGTVFNPGMLAGQDYKRNRWSVGFDLKSSIMNLHGEYLEGKDGKVQSRGAYLTGNKKLVSFRDNTSLDLVASYDFFNFNVDQSCDMHKVVAGLQYWFFKKCRFQAQYVYKSALTDYSTFFENKCNHAIMCQMQIRFN